MHSELVKRMEIQAGGQYYCLILVTTMLFSIELCRSSTDLILEMLVAGGVTMISIYTGKASMLYISIFLNVYIVAKMANMLIDSRRCNAFGSYPIAGFG